jgi:hypothetical protein
MKTKWTWYTLAALALAAAASAAGAPPDRGGRGEDDGNALPGDVRWDLQVLEQSYTVLRTRHDPARNQVVWLLEAKRPVKGANYRAQFLDSDRVQWGDNPIRLTPAKPRYVRGDIVQAVLTLPRRADFAEVTTVTVRAVE